MLPAQARARASWNYRLAGDADAPPTVTYDLNRLQGLTTPEQYCVTLNPDGGIDESQVLRRFVYRHPLYTREAIRAQRHWGEVSGVNRTHYCGAYWRYGFHEDGLHSALRVAARAGSRVVIDSGLFVGTLRHRRFTPVAHAFTYPLFMALLDIDRVPELMSVSRSDEPQPLELGELRRSRSSRRSDSTAPGTARRSTRRATESMLPDGPIFLLTHLRYLGYCFNPVSFFYCFDRAERLQVVLAEVSNTFGGTHNYWLRPDPASRTFRAAATKSLYVSPFMPVDLEYAFAFTPPAGRLVAHMETVRPARWASTRRCRSSAGPGTRRRSAARWCAIPR